MPVTNIPGLIENRVKAIQDFHKETGCTGAELDLSGGLDSAVIAGLLVKALGPENVTLVHTVINSSPEQTHRAEALASGLGCRLINLNLTQEFSALVNVIKFGFLQAGYTGEEIGKIEDRMVADPTVLGSFRSCIRAPIGRFVNRLACDRGIRHGTGNECEDRFLRYFQKGGDGEVDTNPIEMLSKSEVQQLAYGLAQIFPNAKQVYLYTIKARPSADLWGKDSGQTDEDELVKQFKVAFTYGKINPETGEILEYGTIERVSRFLDSEVTLSSYLDCVDDLQEEPFSLEAEILLFQAREKSFQHDWPELLQAAIEGPYFTGLAPKVVEALLLAARKAERTTRHKANGSIPTLGHRAELVEAGLLSNELN